MNSEKLMSKSKFFGNCAVISTQTAGETPTSIRNFSSWKNIFCQLEKNFLPTGKKILPTDRILNGNSMNIHVHAGNAYRLFREQVLQGHNTYEITAVFIVSQAICSD